MTTKFDWDKYNITPSAHGNTLAGTHDNLDRLYNSIVGRNADPSGRDYWAKNIQSGVDSWDTVVSGLLGSDEYKDRNLMVQNNPNVTEDQLDSLSSAYKSGLLDTAQVDGISVAPDPTIAGNYNNVSIMGPTPPKQTYDDSALLGQISGLTDQLSSLRSAFDTYKEQSASDMQNMWNNANWGWGYGSGVGGVRTQNELPGWAPRRGGTSGFFGRGGRAGKGLTTSSLNI